MPLLMLHCACSMLQASKPKAKAKAKAEAKVDPVDALIEQVGGVEALLKALLEKAK